MGNLFTKILIAQYLVVCVAYAWERDWPKAGYFLSAAAISVSVLWMK